MGPMSDNTCNQMNDSRWDNPHAFWDPIDHSNLRTTSSGKVKRTSEHFSRYGSDDLWAKIEPPSFQQYKPGDFLAVRPLNWDEIMDEDDVDENWADPRASSVGRRHHRDANDNDDSEGDEDMQASERRTGI